MRAVLSPEVQTSPSEAILGVHERFFEVPRMRTPNRVHHFFFYTPRSFRNLRESSRTLREAELITGFTLIDMMHGKPSIALSAITVGGMLYNLHTDMKLGELGIALCAVTIKE